MKTVVVIQARMGSTRLPGKVLMDLGGKPVLHWVVRACQRSSADEVWVATSVLPADDAIAAWCVRHNVHCHRGPEDDVLARFVGTATASQADIILRITADCPFIDGATISSLIRLQKATKAAFVTNVSPRTYPDGLDAQLMTRDALMVADKEAWRASDRDGVCTWIERNRSRFPAETLICPIPGLEKERWVLDTQKDYEFCKAVAERWAFHLGPPSMLDMLDVLDRWPNIRKINAGHIMNERYFDALAQEPIYDRTYQRSQKALARAEKVIPLGAQTFSKSRLQYPQPSPLFLSHGQGGLCWDIDGNEYVDLVSALLPNILGYRDPDIDAAVRKQLSNGISFSLATELEAELAEILCRLIPCAEGVRFGKSGTDATSAAIRIARAFTGRDEVLICGGYHGWQDWSIQRHLGVPEAVRKLSTVIPFGTNPFLQGQARYAAVIVEPDSNPAYLKLLRNYCTQTDAILIFDEVITGFRYSLGGAQKLYDVTPDLACFGKAMANGMPLSAVVGRSDVMAKFAPPDNVFYSGTFFGETLSLAAGIATIKKLEQEDLIPKLWVTGDALAWNIQSMLDGLNGAITLYGEAPFKRLRFRDDDIAALFRRAMVNSGTLITASNNINAAHGPNEITRIKKSYAFALGEVRAALNAGDIKQRLGGATVAGMVRAG